MDSGKTDNELELTSTMGNVLSVSIKDEKNDTSGSDATPTSSTDANTTTTSSQIVSDDPISSTSSDLVDLNKSKNSDVNVNVEVTQTTMDEPDRVDAETDLLEMSISSVSQERITEDVEDLVHDLESLLGEPTDSFISIKPKEPPTVAHVSEKQQRSDGKRDISCEGNVEMGGDQKIADDNKSEDVTRDESNLPLEEEKVTEDNVNEVAEKIEEISRSILSDGKKSITGTFLQSDISAACEQVEENQTEIQPEKLEENQVVQHEALDTESDIIGDGAKSPQNAEDLSVANEEKDKEIIEIYEGSAENVKTDNANKNNDDGSVNDKKEEVEDIEKSEKDAAKYIDVNKENPNFVPVVQGGEIIESSHVGKDIHVNIENSDVTVEVNEEILKIEDIVENVDINEKDLENQKLNELEYEEITSEIHVESISENVEYTEEKNSGTKEIGDTELTQVTTMTENSEASVARKLDSELSPPAVTSVFPLCSTLQTEESKKTKEADTLQDKSITVDDKEVKSLCQNEISSVNEEAKSLCQDNNIPTNEKEAESLGQEESVPTDGEKAKSSQQDENIPLDGNEAEGRLQDENTLKNAKKVLESSCREEDILTDDKKVESLCQDENIPTDDKEAESLRLDQTSSGDNKETETICQDRIMLIPDYESVPASNIKEAKNICQNESIPRNDNDSESLGQNKSIPSEDEQSKSIPMETESLCQDESVSRDNKEVENVCQSKSNSGDEDTEVIQCVNNDNVSQQEISEAVAVDTEENVIEFGRVEEIITEITNVDTVEVEEAAKDCNVKSDSSIFNQLEVQGSDHFTQNIFLQKEIDDNNDNTASGSTVFNANNSNVETLKEKVELPHAEDPDSGGSRSPANIPEFLAVSTDCTGRVSVCSIQNVETVNIETEDALHILPVVEPCSDIIEFTEQISTEIPKLPVEADSLLTEAISDIAEPSTSDADITLEISEITAEEGGSEIKSSCEASVDLASLSTNYSAEITPSGIQEIKLVSNSKDKLFQLQNLIDEEVEADISKEKEQMQQPSEKVSAFGITEKRSETYEEISAVQLVSEMSESEVADSESIKSEYVPVQTNMNDASLIVSQSVEEVNEECEPISSAEDIPKYSVTSPKTVCVDITTELTNEEVKTSDVSSIDVDIPKSTESAKFDEGQELVEKVIQESEVAPSAVIMDAINIEDNKVFEISDDEDSKIMQVERGSVPFYSPSGDSDSEDTVPTLVLEPDEVIPSPIELENESTQIDETPLIVQSTISTGISDKLPEIEILNDQETVDDVENIDMQQNLETILAVANLQNEDSVGTEEVIADPPISDKEKKELEALRKAVESITDTPPIDYEEVDEVVQLVDNFEQPVENDVNERESVSKEFEESKVDEVLSKRELESEEKLPLDTEIETESAASKFQENHLECGVIGKTVPNTSENKVEAIIEVHEEVLPDSSQNVSVTEEVNLMETLKEKEGKVKINERSKRHKKSFPDHKLEELSINVDVPEREKPYSPKVTIKPIKVPDEEVSTTSNSDSEFCKGSLKMTITKQSDKMHSVLKICESDTSESTQEQDEPIPKLIIKPKMQQVEQQHSPKMSTRSSKQMYSPTSSSQRSGSPRITIKPVLKPDKVESVTPLKIKIKPEEGTKKHSPKLNIKLVNKPEEECRENIQSPRKVTIKPVVKSDEIEQVHSPRITIKPIPKPESEKESTSVMPRLNIKPIKKVDEEDIEVERERSSPKITIKPVVKPHELDTPVVESDEAVKERIVLKINKGNLPTPTKESKKREHPPDDEKSEKLAKITVKFSKGGGHPHIVHQPEESNKRTCEDQPSMERVKKMKTDNESAVLTRSRHKDVQELIGDTPKMKQKEVEAHILETRSKHTHTGSDSGIESKRIKLREIPETSHVESARSKHRDSAIDLLKSKVLDENDDVRIIETNIDSPIVISEDSRSQDSGSCIIIEDTKDPLGNIPMYDVTVKVTPETPPVVPVDSAISIPSTPTPKKRGRPRKVPIVVREDFKEEEPPKIVEEPQPVHESGRPKRSCRGQNVRATLGIKPRKPRGPGRGRGGKRGMGTRALPMKPETGIKLNKTKLKLIQDSVKIELLRADEGDIEKDKKLCDPPVQGVIEEEIKRPVPVLTSSIEVPSSPTVLRPDPSSQGLLASPPSLLGVSPKSPKSLLTTDIADSTSVPPATPSSSRVESVEIVMVDEETRMSADTNSRAQTPAKQVTPADVIIEESQSSVQSTATTESGKAGASSRPNKAPRLEVQEPEGAVISADQLTEYYWNGNGPFMLQEQVAQFLGIKSFKRKYPGIMRRMLEMQERDFIRESGLASEHMCDLGLTAVNSADILDIMYSDFQEKYEEYCKHQRDRQAKELINKQKALSLAASQEKNKADITEQAVQSAAQWNASFNKTRREQRKACMDLQTLTVHFPKGKMKQINKPKVGNFPVSLVPGQFTDYYKEFTPTEINNLPLNTLCYNEINIIPPEDSEDSGSDASDSDSDSSSSSSGSCSSSSGIEDCKLCKHTPKKGTISK